MNYLKNNKLLLKKYLLILLFNIIFYILNNFYIGSSDSSTIILLLIIFISDYIIYLYKEKVVFKYYLDIILNLLVGLILLIFIKEEYNYYITIFSIFLSNNIIFMKSRISDKFLIRSLEYLLIMLITILCFILCYFIKLFI